MIANSFITGGPVPHNSPVYIERSADDKAQNHLMRMEYVTLIEPRQQGKTSLIHRLAETMKSSHVFAYINIMRLDKTNEAAWYESLCRILCRKVNFMQKADCISFPHNGSEWGDFMTILAEGAREAGSKLVIALDELGDMQMDWQVDFFSNIRAIFDERPNEPCYEHITYILAGTYSPRALINDSRTSPFNVAQQVHIPDFTLNQTKKLIFYLGLSQEDTSSIAQTIQSWTDGHPYLTQRLCRTLFESERAITVENVKSSVDLLYQEDTNHLPHIIEALDSQNYLRKYVKKILDGHKPQFRPVTENRYHGTLARIGVVKADEQGLCKVRNRIYEKALKENFEISYDISQNNSDIEERANNAIASLLELEIVPEDFKEKIDEIIIDLRTKLNRYQTAKEQARRYSNSQDQSQYEIAIRDLETVIREYENVYISIKCELSDI
jgi:hypothetical protein